MQQRNRLIIYSLVLIALAIGGLTTIAIAAPNLFWETSSADPGVETQGVQSEVIGDSPDENGFSGSVQEQTTQDDYAAASGENAPVGLSVETDSEPQPDEDGYTGPIPEKSQGVSEPSSKAGSSTQPDWDSLISEPQADDNLEAPAEPGWSSTFYYVHVAGSALRPRDSSVEWDSDGSGGCLFNNGGNTSIIYNNHLDIPNGSRIDYLRLYYYDTSASDSYAWVTLYDDAGGYDDLTLVSSDGDGGYGTTLSSLVEHVVDNVSYSYTLNWRPYVEGSDMQLCGLRVAYRLPD
jgi:hypothetical protein